MFTAIYFAINRMGLGSYVENNKYNNTNFSSPLGARGQSILT